MAKTSVEMVRDVLEWNLEAEDKLSFISQIVRDDSAIPAHTSRRIHRAACKQPSESSAQKPTVRFKDVYRKGMLWANCKKADPEGAKKLNYTYVTNEELEKFLAKPRR